MSRRYGLYEPRQTRDFLTYNGRIIAHHDAAQAEFLVPGIEAREIPPTVPDDQCTPLHAMPDFAAVQWGPHGELDRAQFRDSRRGS